MVCVRAESNRYYYGYYEKEYPVGTITGLPRNPITDLPRNPITDLPRNLIRVRVSVSIRVRAMVSVRARVSGSGSVLVLRLVTALGFWLVLGLA